MHILFHDYSNDAGAGYYAYMGCCRGAPRRVRWDRGAWSTSLILAGAGGWGQDHWCGSCTLMASMALEGLIGTVPYGVIAGHSYISVREKEYYARSVYSTATD